MIRFEHVTKRLGGKLVLDDISYEVRPGEIFFIVGASGTGKSVSLKHMVRLLTPDSGRVWVGADCISEARAGALETIRRRIGFLFQGAALLRSLTIGENIGLPLRQRTLLTPAAIEEKVRAKLALVNLQDVYERYPADLSGGMQKRAGLARAIVMEPQIILYDEPTSGLDPVTARKIDALIQSLQRGLGVTAVVVTHDLQSALAIGTRIAMLAEGHLVECAAPADFIRSENETVREFLEAQYITRRGSWERNEKP